MFDPQVVTYSNHALWYRQLEAKFVCIVRQPDGRFVQCHPQFAHLDFIREVARNESGLWDRARAESVPAGPPDSTDNLEDVE